MPPPPKGVALVARTHWMVGGVIVAGIALLHFATRKLPYIEVGSRTYLITGGLALLYLLGGTLVWFGAPFGPLLSRVCGLLYLSRPRLGSFLWETMNTPEFKAHFIKTGNRKPETGKSEER
jgi:hypothetical protein